MQRVLVTGGSGFIGSHLVTLLNERGYEVLNIDVVAPRETNQMAFWRECSILDAERMESEFLRFQPEAIIHLAANADVSSDKKLSDYSVNTAGTENVLNACRKSQSTKRVVITSTQHVRRPGSPFPKDDSDFVPYMAYGESKAATEQLTRQANLSCVWTIVRPTAVWGPGHVGLANGLWSVMRRGRYFHPSNDTVVRSYGYVKNVVWQMCEILKMDPKAVHARVFYVADCNMNQSVWVDALSVGITGKVSTKIPKWAIYVIARFGDLLKQFGVSFPMYSERFLNLVTPNPVPVEATIEVLGPPPYDLANGIRETVKWFNEFQGKPVT